MPRLSSLRPLRSLATSGVLSACLLGAGVASFAQPPSSYPTTTPPGYGSSDPYGANGQDPNALQNVPSGIKRSDVSSVVPLQALLYSDVDEVYRVNLAKIDYVGLNDFFGEIVDKGVGSIRSDDSYRVKLRDYQKSELKSSFRAMLTALQNFATKDFFANKIDEVYVVKYATGGKDATTIWAVPTDGLSDADQKLALEKLEKLLKPITLFNRYGFVVAVVDHQNAVKPNLQAIQANFLAQAQTQLAQNGASSATGYAGSAPYGSNGSQTIAGVPNDLNLPDGLYREYAAAVEEAETNAKTESRKKVLPFVRRRFEKPADAGSPFFDALKQTDGTAIAVVVDADGLQAKIADKAKKATQTDVASVLAGSFAGSKTDAAQDKTSAVDLESLASQPYAEDFKTATFAASLVGSPKLALILAFDSPETAKKQADAANAALTLAKPLAAQQVVAATKGNAEADLSPVVDAVFEGIKPQTAGSKVAFVLDLDVLKQNATALVPLFGGVETKSAQEMESDGIDWDLEGEDGEATEEAPAEETSKATEEEAPADEDDPFAEEADEATEEEAPADEDDPFAEDEEDPFA
ncbi:MAG: hypothetical protein IJO40_08635 [Thermoguttaceae bacterium]|nr:hypothetical protein [Thermoguttaceae bacterium]